MLACSIDRINTSAAFFIVSTMINKIKVVGGQDIARLTHPYIIDLEASGFGPESYPIEVGLALDEGERYCSLIRPKADWEHWSTEAEQYHHIERDILLRYGKSAEVVATELNERLYNMTVYSDGWVVDQSWLIKLFYRAGIPMQFRVSALEMILSEDQMEIWHEVKAQILTELALQRHRASNDALVIQKTYKKTLKLTEQICSV